MTATRDIQPILDRALAGERLTGEDCTALLESDDFVRMGLAADEIRRRRHPEGVVPYIIDRKNNYTNVCNVACTCCAFYRRPGAGARHPHREDEPEARVLAPEARQVEDAQAFA